MFVVVQGEWSEHNIKFQTFFSCNVVVRIHGILWREIEKDRESAVFSHQA